MSQSQKNWKGGSGRSKNKEPCVNPIFESWIIEWKEEAEAKDSKMRYVYAKALKSLRLFPIVLSSGKDCKLLENFGDHMCKMIDMRMAKEKMIPRNESLIVQDDQQPGPSSKIKKKPTEEPAPTRIAYVNDPNLPRRKKALFDFVTTRPIIEIPPLDDDVDDPFNTGASGRRVDDDVIVLSSDDDEAASAPPVAKKARKTGKEYVPAYRSGGYAILLAMITKQIEASDYRGYMTRTEILNEAQKYCDTSMTRPDTTKNSHYSAWNSMSLLVKKDLVAKMGNPAKYSLTAQGDALAGKLYDAEKQQGSAPRPLPETNSSDSQAQAISPIISQATQSTEIDSDAETEVVGPIYEAIMLLPGKFEVVLYVDTCETSGNSKSQDLINELQKNGVTVHVTRLSVGDFVWVCREVTSVADNRNRLTIGNQVELVLPYVVERKRADDLAHSIRDGRYREQKYRLERTKLEIIYLMESYGTGDWGLGDGALKQAMASTQIRNEFKIQETSSIKDTCAYLTFMTRNLKSMYENKTVVGRHAADYTKGMSSEMPNLEYALLFSDFNDFSAKKTSWNAKALFARQLVRMKGMSTDKAFAIVSTYPTVHHLISAYSPLHTDIDKGKLLADIRYGTGERRIGPSISRKIARFYNTKVLLP